MNRDRTDVSEIEVKALQKEVQHCIETIYEAHTRSESKVQALLQKHSVVSSDLEDHLQKDMKLISAELESLLARIKATE